LIGNQIELDMFQMIIQKLSFTYCIPFVTLCDLTYRTECFCAGDDDIPYDEYHNIIRKYGRILGRFCNGNTSISTVNGANNKPKIYDEYLLESQIDLYNETAKMAGYARIEKILPISLIQDSSSLDGGIPDYDIIVKYYPYYTDGKREGINFLEVVLLLNVYFVVHSRGLNIINKPLLSKRDKQKANNMVEKIIQNMNSKEMFPLYVHVFFDVVDLVTCKMHNKTSEECMRTAWLPKHYKNRKDVFRAYETYLSEDKKINLKPREKTQMDEKMENGTFYERMKMLKDIDDYSTVEYIGGLIFPIAFAILTETLDENEIKKDEKEYLLALEYAEIIKTYIEKTIAEVTNILNKIYIVKN